MSYRRPRTMRQLRRDVPVQALALTACSANSLSYTFIGSPSGEDLRNTFGWSVGPPMRSSSPCWFSASSGSFGGATTITPEPPDPVELSVGAEYKLLKALK